MSKSRPRPSSTVPNPVVKRILQPLKRLLQGPYGIAAIASVSFHGVVFALGPTLSNVSIAAFDDTNGDGNERTVPLVELSPAEQGRLPDFTAQRSFTGRVPVPSNRPPTVPIQRPPQRSRLSSPIPPQRTTGLPQRTTGLQRSTSPLTGRQRTQPSNRSNPYVWSGSTRISRIPLPPALAGQGLPAPRRNTPAEPQPETETELEAASTPTTGPDAATESSETPSNLAESTGNDTGLSLAGLQNPQSVSDGSETSGETAATPESEGSESEGSESEGNDGEGSESEGNSDLAGITPEDSTSPEEVASNTVDPEQARLQQLRDSLQWNAAGTAIPPAEAGNWIANLQASEENLIAAQGSQNINSNIRVCVDNPPTNAIVGILVQPDGSITETRLIQRTGYDATDQAALNSATAVAAPTEGPTAYQINVNVGYDAENCIEPGSMLE